MDPIVAVVIRPNTVARAGQNTAPQNSKAQPNENVDPARADAFQFIALDVIGRKFRLF